MISLKNQIKEISNEYDVGVLAESQNERRILSGTRFKINLFATIERSNLLTEKAKFVELFFQTTDTRNRNLNTDFNDMFPNTYAENTYDSKKYSNGTRSLENGYADDIRSNLIINYHNNSTLPTIHSTNAFEKMFSFVDEFKVDLFVENSNRYKIEIDEDTSKKIFNKSFTFDRDGVNGEETGVFFSKIRMAILDENKNILDITDFFAVNLSSNNLNENFKFFDFERYYGNTINDFLNSFDLEFLFQNNSSTGNIDQGSARINVFGSETIYLHDGLIRAEISYRNKTLDAELSFLNNPGVEQSFIIDRFTSTTEEINDFIKNIIKDYLCGIDNFDITSVIIFYNISTSGERQTIKTFSKISEFNRSSNFIEKSLEYCDGSTEFTNEIINSILRSFNVEVQSMETLGTKVGIDFSISLDNSNYDNRVLDKVLVEQINLDIGRSNNNLDFYYSQPTFDLSNKIDYKNKSVNFFNLNSKIWSAIYIASILRNTFDFTFTIKHVDRDNATHSIQKSIQNFEAKSRISEFVENTQNLTNKIFNENMFCGDIDFNLFFTSSINNIFNYETFILKNSNLFQDLALGYGYDQEENVDAFLNNSILKITIDKTINGDNLSNYEVFCNFNEFFTKSSSNVNSYKSKNSFFENLYNKQLNTNLSLTRKGTIENSDKIVDFLNISNSNVYEKILSLSNLNEFDITCKIKIQILPFPAIIKENLGVGFLDDTSSRNRKFRNININFPSDMSEEERKRVRKEFDIMYIDFARVNANDRIDFNFINQIDDILFSDSEIQKSPAHYSGIFVFYEKFSIANNNLYSKTENINKTKISRTLNNLDSNAESLINSSNINLATDFLDLLKNTSYIKYKQIPFSVFYGESSYNSEEKCFLPKKIKFYNNTNDDFILDASSLKEIDRYSESDFRDIFRINRLSNQPSFSDVVINENIIFVLKKYEGDNTSYTLPEDSDNLNTTFFTTFYKGDSCIVNENFLESNYIPSNGIKTENISGYSDIFDFFNSAMSLGFKVIKDIIIRTYISFKIDDNVIRVVFSTSIPTVNLSNQIVKIDDISEITSEDVSI